MPFWSTERAFQHEELTIQIQRESLASRTPDRIVKATQGVASYQERVPWNVWEGHCSGQLWLPDFYTRARAQIKSLRNDNA